MATTFEQQQHARRTAILLIVGAILLVVAAIAGYLAWRQLQTGTSLNAAYHYAITQSMESAVDYHDNSFYADGPTTADTAYVAPLTKDIKGVFHYKFTGSKPADLRYSYDVASTIRGTYTLTGKEDEAANVWSRRFQLVAPVETTASGGTFAIDQAVTIPFEEYRLLIDQYRATMQVPVSGELEVVLTVRVSGTVDGTAFTSTKTQSIDVPLTQQIYQPALKFEKLVQQDVVSDATKKQAGVYSKAVAIGAVVAAAIGVACLALGIRRRIFTSSYQRELDKIYRYHEGIIIRAKDRPDLSGKSIVPVRSFDDMLNLEEELKVPIVSSEVGEHATRFMIIRDDVVYQYLLGVLPTDDVEVMKEIQDAFPVASTPRKPAARKSIHRKIQ